jgi:hypothetical protein
MDTSPLASYLKARQGQYLRPDTLVLLKQLEKEFTELEAIEKNYTQMRASAEKHKKEMLSSSDSLLIKDAEAAVEATQRIKLVIPLAKKQRKELFKNKIYPLIRPILDKAIVVAASFPASDAESILFYQHLHKRVIELQSGKIIASPQYWMTGLAKIS